MKRGIAINGVNKSIKLQVIWFKKIQKINGKKRAFRLDFNS
jgi:predicted DNA-binding ribbon-helix-helix protein